MAIERVYRDDRLPDVEIRNCGGSTFNIWVRGEIPNYHSESGWTNTDCFTHYQHRNGANHILSYEVDPVFAEKAAAAHFEDMLEEMAEE